MEMMVLMMVMVMTAAGIARGWKEGSCCHQAQMKMKRRRRKMRRVKQVKRKQQQQQLHSLHLGGARGGHLGKSNGGSSTWRQ
jgi:hypothetical protein